MMGYSRIQLEMAKYVRVQLWIQWDTAYTRSQAHCATPELRRVAVANTTSHVPRLVVLSASRHSTQTIIGHSHRQP